MASARTFGLIGKKLGHSFSKKYFTDKFEKEGLSNCSYQLFELEDPAAIVPLLQNHPNIVGLNVTIPYKEKLFPYLTDLAPSAQKVGAVNVIEVQPNRLIGHNSDFYGFKRSLSEWLPTGSWSALVLGTGGASKAVQAVLRDMGISFQLVSRKPSAANLDYEQLKDQPEIMTQAPLIINTTPLGMHPNTEEAPDIPYQALTSDHLVYDLVYNPEQTLLMKQAVKYGAQVKNGMQMLHLQAERSWEIWNT